MDNQPHLIKIKCKECDHEIEVNISDKTEGDIIECPVCGVNLEFLRVDTVNNVVEVEPVVTYK